MVVTQQGVAPHPRQVLHFMILYIPWAAALFSVTALSWADWGAVLWLSAPVVLLDECLKVCSH